MQKREYCSNILKPTHVPYYVIHYYLHLPSVSFVDISGICDIRLDGFQCTEPIPLQCLSSLDVQHAFCFLRKNDYEFYLSTNETSCLITDPTNRKKSFFKNCNKKLSTKDVRVALLSPSPNPTNTFEDRSGRKTNSSWLTKSAKIASIIKTHTWFSYRR